MSAMGLGQGAYMCLISASRPEEKFASSHILLPGYIQIVDLGILEAMMFLPEPQEGRGPVEDDPQHGSRGLWFPSEWECPPWLIVYFPSAGNVGPEEEIKVAGPLPPRALHKLLCELTNP